MPLTTDNQPSLLRVFLEKQIELENCIELSRSEYDDEPIRGVIRKLKGNLLFVQITNQNFLTDVISVLFLSDISSVHSTIQEVTKNENTAQKYSEGFSELPEFKLNTIWKVASWAENKFGAVKLYFEDVEPYRPARGKILEQDLDYVLLEEFNSENTKAKGKSVFERKFITRLDFGDIFSEGKGPKKL